MEAMRNLILVNLLNDENHEIICSLNDNGVSIKKKLSDEIGIDELKIQLLIDRSVICNEFIPRDQNRIYFQIVDLPITDVILEIKKNHFGIPQWIQVSRNSTIGDVKNMLSTYSQDNLITFLFDENGEISIDNETVDSCGLKHNFKIKVWRGLDLLVTLNICNPNKKVNESQMIQAMQFSIMDSINEVKKKISAILVKGKELNLALFTDFSYLQNKKRLIDYPFCNGNDIFYSDLIKREEVIIEDRINGNKKYAKIFRGKFGSPPQEVVVNKYKLNNEQINVKKILKYEIVTRNKMSKAKINRFVRLISMYEDQNYFFIVTDYMKRGSLKSRYLDPNLSPLQEKEIIRYSIQICEALNYMHDNQFIHRNLSCSSVLIDDNDDIKLSNFYLSKYLFNYTMQQIKDGVPGSKIDPKRCWLAPEVLREENYGLNSDIWSFGVTVMEMLTRNRPYPHMNVVLATHRITTENTIQYNRENISPKLSDVIDRCIHSSQWERPTAKQCIQLFTAIV